MNNEDVSFDLKSMSKIEVMAFIRGVLNRNEEHYISKYSSRKNSFDMSMQNHSDRGEVIKETQRINLHNNKILENFSFCGIYGNTKVLYLTSWKGNINIVYSYDGDYIFNTADEQPYGGWTTTEIIYEVFKLTVLK